MRGRRRSPGRPITFATTDAFLEHYGLASLTDLPGAQEMKTLGLLGGDAPFNFTAPDLSIESDGEDPLDPGDAPEFNQDYLSEDGRA
jgi:segregation and condensation protein B